MIHHTHTYLSNETTTRTVAITSLLPICIHRDKKNSRFKTVSNHPSRQRVINLLWPVRHFKVHKMLVPNMQFTCIVSPLVTPRRVPEDRLVCLHCFWDPDIRVLLTSTSFTHLALYQHTHNIIYPYCCIFICITSPVHFVLCISTVAHLGGQGGTLAPPPPRR